MNDELKEKNERNIGEMRKRREKMADGKRYVIYYTFGERADEFSKIEAEQLTEKEENEENENV